MLCLAVIQIEELVNILVIVISHSSGLMLVAVHTLGKMVDRANGFTCELVAGGEMVWKRGINPLVFRCYVRWLLLLLTQVPLIVDDPALRY